MQQASKDTDCTGVFVIIPEYQQKYHMIICGEAAFVIMQETDHHIQVVVTADKKFTYVRKRLAFKMNFPVV